ncbi:MAG: hypothetical protein HY360_07625 [Verrucomicrobia bacterium]|nr:hypothetical protein [Verrucomicrobiota bacterium]
MIPVEANQLFYFLGSLGACLWIFNQSKQAFGFSISENKRDEQIQILERKMETGQQRIHERIDELGINLTNAVGELRGELRRIKT